MTTALGEAYITALEALFVKHDGEQPSQEEVLAALAGLRKRAAA